MEKGRVKHILKCQVCDEYSMQAEHCGKKTNSPKPMRYSPGRFAEHRRKARKEELKEKGLF